MKKPRGFAAISSERRREIAQLGGQAAQASGNAHRFTSETAAAAGSRGACRDRERMQKLGSAGGRARAANLASKKIQAKERSASDVG